MITASSHFLARRFFTLLLSSAVGLGALSMLSSACTRTVIYDPGFPDADGGPNNHHDAGLDGGADAGPDAGIDAGADAGADAGPDAGRDGGSKNVRCEGPAAVALGQRYASPVFVTGDPLIMDCCDGAFFQLHTEEQLGEPLALMLRSMGLFADGRFELNENSHPYTASIMQNNGAVVQPITGSLQAVISAPGAPELPPTFSICGSFELDGQQGALWIPSASVMPVSWMNRLELHLLANPSVTALDAATRPLDSLTLERNPTLTLADIAWYTWSRHAITLGGPNSPEELARNLPTLGTKGLPFVISVDQQRIYLGAFFPGPTNEPFFNPVILLQGGTGNELILENRSGGIDLREDPRIQQLLIDSNKFIP